MEVFCYVVADVWKCMYIDTFFSVLRWGDSPRKPSLTWTCHMCSGRVEADSEALAWKRVSQIPTGGIFGACRRCLWSEVRVRLTLTRKEAHPYFEAISGSPFTCSLTWSSIQSNMDELHSLQAGPWDDSDEFTSCSGSHTCPIFSAFDLDLIVFPSDFFLQIFEKNWNSHATQRCCEHAVCEQTVTIVQYIVGYEVVLCSLVKLMGTKLPNQQ